MHHIGTITKSSKFPTLEFNGQCSCGTAGHFATRDEAASYLTGHFSKQGGMSTTELVDHSDQAEETPALPLPHAEAPSAQTGEQLEHDGPATEVTEFFPVSQESAPVEGEMNWKKKKK